MRRIIRGLAAFAVLLVVFSIVSPAASAVKTMPAEVTRIAGGTWVNPLDGDLPDETEPSSAEPSDGLSGDRSVISTEQAIVSMRQHLVNRDASFSVTVPAPDGDLNDYAWYLIRHSMDHTGVPDEGDYIISQFRSLNWQFQQTDDELTVSLTVSYRSSRSQENQVDQKVAQILEELDLPRENDYETFLAVYGYLTEHVTYPSNNPGIAHTAYGALINNSAVCQGFASALYRLCLEAGIDCRYCSSTAQNHAWNIVGLNGEYYLTDATWDRKKDENAFYRYCLCGTEDWRTRHFTSNGTSTTFGDEFYGKNDPNGKPDVPWFDPVEQYPLSRVGFEEGRHLLTVDYVYPSGSQAAQSYSSMKWPCDTYSVPVPSIAGYTPSMSTVTGSMPGHDLSVTVEYVPAGHVHSWNSGTVTTAATCTDCGVKTYSCSCGATKTERIAPNGHTYSGNNCTVCGLQTVAKGTITGGSAKWTLESNGKLTVFGDGFMGVLSSLERVPWKANLADITSVEIREGITTVCTLAFDGCTNLTSVSLPEGLLSVCNKAFHGCTSLTELELPDSVRLIDKNAFLDAGLTSLSLGESAYYFGPDCFNGCNDLNEVSYAGTLEQWCYADIKNVLGNPGWCASSFTVSGEELAGEIRIPEPVRKVRPYTFVNRSLTSVDFPETLQAIGKMAFSGDDGLEEMVFTGDCPEAGESFVNDAALEIHYPCANGTWNDSSMAELSNETHMPGCTVEEWCKDHLWDDGTWVTVDGHSVLRYTCLKCGETSDGPSSETISITLTKNWSDENNQDGIRPSSVTVNVVGKNPSGTVVVPSFAVTITSANNWTKTVGDLDKYYQGNQLITYSIQSENAVSGYTASISGLTVTNTHTPATTSITLTKNWSDGNNQDGIRPSSVTVNVVGKNPSGTVVVPSFAVTITAAENWTKTVSGLAQKNAGQTITYSIQSETAVSGYTASISGLTVTNTHTPATTSITLTKTWADDENRLGLRPADVTVSPLICAV